MTKRSTGNANSKSLSFTIPGPLPSLNKLLRLHWAKRRRLKQDYVWTIMRSPDWFDMPDLKETKRRVSIVVYQPTRRFDEDNLIGATKLLVDALRETGVIFRDSPKWLERKISQEIDRANPRVEITVEEA